MILKKSAAIFFLILFSFNWFGYRLMYDYMEKQAGRQLDVALDNHDYDEAQLIVIKIPVHNSYQSNRNSYERYNGEIEINGVKYKYVKRKLLNDTLYLKCIPNAKAMMLQFAKDDIFRLTNDLFQNNDSKKTDNNTSAFKNLQPVFYESYMSFNLSSQFDSGQKNWIPQRPENLPSIVHLSADKPPEYSKA